MSNQENGDTTSGKSRLGGIKRVAKWLIVLLVAFGLWQTISGAREELAAQREAIRQHVAELDEKIENSPDSMQRANLQAERDRLLGQDPDFTRLHWRWIALAGLVYSIALLCPALFFHQTLIHMNQSPLAMESIAAHLLGHLGKYVPGKAMVVVMRVSAIAGPNVQVGAATVAAFIETLVMMAVGGTVGGIIVTCLQLESWVTWLAVGLVVCTAVPTLPPVFRPIVARIAKTKIGSGKGLDPARIDWKIMSAGWAWMIPMWGGIGLSFLLLILAVPGGVSQGEVSGTSYLLATAAISLAMVAGFISLLPGGAGVRELVLTTLLAPMIGVAPALAAAVLARIVFLVTEVVIGLLIVGARKRRAVPDGT